MMKQRTPCAVPGETCGCEAAHGLPRGVTEGGVLAECTASRDISLCLSVAQSTDVSDNLLRPHLAAEVLPQESDGKRNYLLGLDPDDAGSCVFLPASGTDTLPAGRAYLPLPVETGGTKLFIGFEDDDPTGIKGLPGLNDPEGSKGIIYNLSGQRLQKMQRGVNVVGRKKVMY